MEDICNQSQVTREEMMERSKSTLFTQKILQRI